MSVVLAHVILFVPGILVVGMAIGFVLGGRAARDAIALDKKREEERAARRAERAERAAARSTNPPAANDPVERG